MIEVVRSKIPKMTLEKLAQESFGDMVKGVVDVQKKIIALGGELHADAEEVLLNHDCQQENLWGFNIYLNKDKNERLEYTSLINIRPRQGNLDREVQDPQLCLIMKQIIDALIE